MGRSGERESESLDHHRSSSSRHRDDHHHHKDSKRSRERSRDRDDHHRSSSSKSSHHKKSRRRRDRSRSPSSASNDDDNNDDDSHGKDSRDSGSSVDSRRRDRKKRKENKDHHKEMKKKKSKRKSHHKDERKSKKEKKRKHKDNRDKDRKHKKSRRNNNNNNNNNDTEEQEVVTAADTAELAEKARNYELAEALHALLVEHPTADMSINTLPLLLIKLAGGTSLDLRQMPNRSAANALSKVLETMQTFGVDQVEQQVWKWQVPGGQRPGTAPRDERILLRIVRTLLNDIGFTMESIEEDNHMKISRKQTVEQQASVKSAQEKNPDNDNAVRSALAAIENKTMEMLGKFQNKASEENTKETKPSTLPGELGGLCNMILEGETIALDGLPDESLRVALEELFQTCGLELCEMDDDDDESSDEEGSSAQGVSVEANGEKVKNMGYGLPEQSARFELAKAKLSSVMGACEQVASDPTKLTAAATQKRAMKGPMRMPTNYQAPEDSSDEEGPAPIGEMAKRKESAVSKEMIKRQAELRARQLKGAVTGVDELISTDPNQREEWMLVPGKFDFLSSIKTGNGMKSRNFQAASKAEGVGNGSAAKAVDPRVKQEMDAIMQAHADARGPTLVEQHRLNKEKDRAQKAAAAAGGGKDGKWEWNRDKDLDSGRRVDKNALNMVLGGANSDLKKKFHGGF